MHPYMHLPTAESKQRFFDEIAMNGDGRRLPDGATYDLGERGAQPDEATNSRGDLRQPDVPGRPISCRVDELHPHPAYVRHHLLAATARLSALAERGDLAFHDPLVITRNRTIIDGYCRWELARRERRTAVTCIEYDLTEEEALHLAAI